jgi:hypothetical protein
MIAYMIQCHQDFAQVARLLTWIYHENDIFILSIDANSPDDLGEIDPFFNHNNVFLSPRHRITWGGQSIVDATLSSINLALSRPGWQYFINLSGLDIPLIGRRELCAALNDHASKGVFNFISDFGQVNFEPIVWNGPTDQQTNMISAPNSAQIELNGSLIELMNPGSKSHPRFRPVTEPSLRIAFHVNEGADGKLLACRPLYPFEVAHRTRQSTDAPYRYGRQWVILNRQICEVLFSSAEAISIYQAVKNVFIADEFFFQTLFSTSIGSLPKGAYLRQNQRYYFGEPVRITDENYSKIRGSGAWFARKVVIPECKDVFAKTDELMAR